MRRRGYLAKLVRAGVKVAICEQVEEAGATKGIVKREITRVITPGTVLEDQVLDASRNNFLAGLFLHKGKVGFALLDISTGDFSLEEAEEGQAVMDHLIRYAPSECIVPEDARDEENYQDVLRDVMGTLITSHDEWTFEPDNATDILTRHFKTHSLEGFGCNGCSAAIGAAGAVLHYVNQELRRKVDHVRTLRVHNPKQYMTLDEATINNLELVSSRSTVPGANKATLLAVLDTTSTSMGARLMRQWVLRPLKNVEAITQRHEAVQSFVDDHRLLHELRETLGAVRDLERLIARLSSGSGNPRDLKSVSESLKTIPAVRGLVESHADSLLARLSKRLYPIPDLVERLDVALEDEPPLVMKDGGIIRKGFHAELDELRDAATKGRQWLADFQLKEQARTGIKNLKVRHNKVFGYYIEISKSNLERVPEEYVRKQTLVNAERYITPDLKTYENKILGAQDRANDLEYELFGELRTACVNETQIIQETAEAIAELDVLATLAERAGALNFVRPQVSDSDKLELRNSRHPVVERLQEVEGFVPNDALLDGLENQIMMITGPNMAGKSTYIRQVALVVIMAQMGSFVPASYAEIGVVDRVFTRVGASDDLARGRSTFMVEMQETANILNNATERSLIVLDEIGRGTSTFDGISIAWSVAEYLHNNKDVKARTLFATHYHELTELSVTLPGVKNYNVLVREKDDKIVFLRKIAAGAADKSYGIQVGRLAGLPPRVIQRAKEILSNLEDGEFEQEGQPKIAKKRKASAKADDQLDLF